MVSAAEAAAPIVALLIAAELLCALIVARRRHRAPAAQTLATVQLHTIRRQLELAQFRTAVRRDSYRLRRELDNELAVLARRRDRNV